MESDVNRKRAKELASMLGLNKKIDHLAMENSVRLPWPSEEDGG